MNSSYQVPRSAATLVALLLCAPWLCLAQPPDPSEKAHWFSHGYTPLWGATQDGTFSPASYLLVHDIVIDTGTVMTIEGGTTIFALRNARIVVKGRLVCDGAAVAPVKFVALPPQDYYLPPSGVDTPRWDGIVVERGGELVLRHARLTGTLQGVEAKPGFERLWLDSVAFGSTVDARVVVAGRVAPVKNVALFSLRTSDIEAASASATQRPRWKAPVRIGCGVAMAAGVGLYIGGQVGIVKNQSLYDTARDAGSIAKFKDARDAARSVRTIGLAVLCGAAAGFAVTFIIK